MENEKLKDPYPSIFGFLRIGSAVNYDINKIDATTYALNMGKLASAGCLKINTNSNIKKEIMGGGFLQENQDAWGYSVSSKLGFSTGFDDVGLSFDHAQSKNVCTSHKSQQISVFAKQECSIAIDGNISSKTFLACATEDFIEKIGNIRGQTDETKLLEAIIDFYKTYGTGFVSKLYLGAFSVLQGVAHYTSEYNENKKNYSASCKISGYSVGASAGVDYAKNNIDTNANGEFLTSQFSMPIRSSSSIWVDGFNEKFSSIQLQKLSNLEIWTKSFNETVVKAVEPTFKPSPPKPVEEKKPNQKASTSIEEMKRQNFSSDYKKSHGGNEPPKGEYERNQLQLKEEISELDDNKINNNAKQIDPILTDINTLRFNSGYFQSINTNNLSQEIKDPNMDFNEYGITGYECTPWESIFKDLKGINEIYTSSQIDIGYIMAWFSIRNMFSQYLDYCSEYKEVAPKNIGPSAIAYRTALNKMMDDYVFVNVGEKILRHSLNQKFKEYLKSNNFEFMEHYNYLVENYEWLKRVPFGAVPIVPYNNKYYFVSDKNTSIDINTSNIGSVLLEQYAQRVYPIISTDLSGKPYFIWVSVDAILGNAALSIQNWLPQFSNYNEVLSVLSKYGMNWFPSKLKPTLNKASETAKNSSNIVHLLPNGPYNRSIWKMKKTKDNKTPDCLIFNDERFHDPTTVMLMSGTGREISFGDGTKANYKHLEMYLVPISYSDIKLA